MATEGKGVLGVPTQIALLGVPGSVLVGDMSGDKKPDLVAPTGGAKGMAVLVSQGGGGTFAPSFNYQHGGGPSLALAAGDLRGLGALDVAILTGGGGDKLVLMINHRGGIFQAVDVANISGSAVAIADLDGDGKLDIAVARGAEDKVSVFLNKGAAMSRLTRRAMSPVAGLHASFVQCPLSQSSPTRHFRPAPHFGQLPPPQSTSLS
ncbi:MAG: VCBS repeat-containing protein [Myxococcales bacterium]|nr:VCBS repeat-containing protein [Myxococcales bacterium]